MNEKITSEDHASVVNGFNNAVAVLTKARQLIADKDQRIAELEDNLARLAASDNEALVSAQRELREAKQQIADLEQTVWHLQEKRNNLLEDRNRLLDLIDGGPLSSNEWQIRALRAEAALARFQSEKPELGDLSFREMMRSEMIDAYLRRDG